MKTGTMKSCTMFGFKMFINVFHANIYQCLVYNKCYYILSSSLWSITNAVKCWWFQHLSMLAILTFSNVDDFNMFQHILTFVNVSVLLMLISRCFVHWLQFNDQSFNTAGLNLKFCMCLNKTHIRAYCINCIISDRCVRALRLNNFFNISRNYF